MEFRLSYNLLNNKQDYLISEIKNQITSILKSKDEVNPCFTISLQKLLLIKNESKSQKSEFEQAVIYGRLVFAETLSTNLNYEDYLLKDSIVLVYIRNKTELIKILQKIEKEAKAAKQIHADSGESDEPTLESVIIKVPIEKCFIYRIETDEVFGVNQLIQFYVSFKLYVSYFSKFKNKEYQTIYIHNDNNSERKIMYSAFTSLDFRIANDYPYTETHAVDLYLDFTSSHFINTTKKKLFQTLNYGAILYSESTSFQLDPPDLRYMSVNNITLSNTDLTEFMTSFDCLGKISNFITDFISKVPLSKEISVKLFEYVDIIKSSEIIPFDMITPSSINEDYAFIILKH